MIFQNYQIQKLNITNPESINLCILFLALAAAACSMKKNNRDVVFLNHSQTDQLKGLAILLVIIGHVWVHLSQVRPALIFSGDGVEFFLILSGFGLTRSFASKPMGFLSFTKGRVSRVFIPYWLVTIMILFLDYLLLNRTLPMADVLKTAAGINITPAIRQLDYARWYVTFLLMWYVVFFLAQRLMDKRSLRMLFLFSTAVFISLFDVFIKKLGWFQFYAFPVGCALGIWFESLKHFYESHPGLAAVFGTVMLFGVLLIKFHLLQWPIINGSAFVHKICLELSGILLFFSVLSVLGILRKHRLTSGLLLLSGKISYELFLLHGAFLIKYNPVILSNTPELFMIQLSAFLVCMFFLSKGVKSIAARCQQVM